MGNNLDVEEYQKMCTSMAEFVGIVTGYLTKQIDINDTIYSKLNELADGLNALIQHCNNMTQSKKMYHQTLVDHETRLMQIEKCLKDETIFRGHAMPKYEQ